VIPITQKSNSYIHFLCFQNPPIISLPHICKGYAVKIYSILAFSLPKTNPFKTKTNNKSRVTKKKGKILIYIVLAN